jgi:hypothetical protein
MTEPADVTDGSTDHPPERKDLFVSEPPHHPTLSESDDPELGHHSEEGQRALAVGNGELAYEHFSALVLLFTERAGPTYYRTLVWKAFAAKALTIQGRIEEAITLQRHVIAERTTALGADHPDTFSIRGQLGQTLARGGRPAESLEHQRTLYADKIRVLGRTHPNTLDTLGNIAEALMLCRRWDEAAVAYGELYQLRVEVLGTDHPDTTRTSVNLAIATARKGGDNLEALDTLAANLEHLIAVEEPDGDSALTARGHIADQYLRVGDGYAALTVLTPLASDRQRVLGPDHPDTISTERRLAEARFLVGDLERAVADLEALISRSTAAIGKGHAETISTRLLLLRIRAWSGDADIEEVMAFATEMDGLYESSHSIHGAVDFIIDLALGHYEDEDFDDE